MLTVSELLTRKKSLEVCTIGPDATVLDAVKLFASHNLGALLVVEQGDLVGLVSERDYARKVILKGRRSESTRVREIMTADVVSVSPGDSIETCMELMISRYIRHLPVMDGRRLIGIVSIGDVVKGVLDAKEFVIDELVRYITDSPMAPPARPQTLEYCAQSWKG